MKRSYEIPNPIQGSEVVVKKVPKKVPNINTGRAKSVPVRRARKISGGKKLGQKLFQTMKWFLTRPKRIAIMGSAIAIIIALVLGVSALLGAANPSFSKIYYEDGSLVLSETQTAPYDLQNPPKCLLKDMGNGPYLMIGDTRINLTAKQEAAYENAYLFCIGLDLEKENPNIVKGENTISIFGNEIEYQEGDILTVTNATYNYEIISSRAPEGTQKHLTKKQFDALKKNNAKEKVLDFSDVIQ